MKKAKKKREERVARGEKRVEKGERRVGIESVEEEREGKGREGRRGN